MRPALHAALHAAALFATLAAMPASAVTMISRPGAPDPGPFARETMAVTFDIARAPGFRWASAPALRTSSQSGVAAAPAGITGRFGFVSTGNGQPRHATLRTPALRSISFYWGSVDSHNKVTLLGRDQQVLASFTGSQLPVPNGSWWTGEANRRVGFVADQDEWIHGLRLEASGVAFEFDNFAANAVPEPASWALLIAGFGLAGAMQRRREAGLARAVAG